MAMLERYRKPGGFLQILSLIETCNVSKQEKLLDTIATEDRVWAETIRAKMLNINRIFSWSDETLMEVIGSLQDLTVAVTINSSLEPLRSRLTNCVSRSRRSRIEDLFGSNPPTSGEVSAMHMKIVENVRKMVVDGSLRLDKVDPALLIEEDIDDRLLHPSGPARKEPSLSIGSADSVGTVQSKLLHSYSPLTFQPSASPTAPQASSSSDSGSSSGVELQLLKKRVLDLSKENAILRHELSITRSKLDQIKKIA